MVHAPRTEARPPAARPAAAPRGTGQRTRRRLPSPGRVVYLVLLVGFAVLFLYPLVWLVSASLKPRNEVFDNKLIPDHATLHNLVSVWHSVPMLNWLLNSIVVGLAAATTVTASSALVAFGFAYFRFRGRGPLFGLVLATMMLPGAVTMIPVYLIWHELGLATTQIPLWAQNLFGSAFYIFLLRQFFLGIPRDLFEAARLDGCSYFGLFRRIALPLAKPSLVIVFVFELQASWTDLMKPLIYLQSEKLYTLPRGLKLIVDQFGQNGEYHWEIVMAGSLVATVPMILVFAFAQRYFLQGASTSGQKR